jgi:site-specific DNA recombinase
MSCRERWGIINSYEDATIAGASVVRRSGIQRFIRNAQRGDFTVVLAEALYRISRYQAGVAAQLIRPTCA